jgi:DNA-directed RNA polymerase specialized sigma24 family protein
VDLQALATHHGDARAVARLEGGVHQTVRRYCRALLGRSDEGFGQADALADELARSILRDRRAEFGGPSPAEAIVYSGMAPVVARVLGERPVPPRPQPGGWPSPEHVHEQLRRLPPRAREVLVLRAFVGMTSEQAARALGLTPEAVRQEQRLALSRLRSL